ncbi:hypothetical protein PVAP13_6NG112100 [Panicum virgatum]|uniref:Myb/SANT-like domain-containing protein n=1 Tax=Panicum virgatum TaxID=38727 RepID=A0A8T0R0W9_PANVG|nr:hypothetical protein PVAP13_6NG112100 [Panicum virgatum]
MDDKADWGDGLVSHLFDACKEEIEVGNRPMEIFTTTGWKNVVSKFAQKSGDSRTKKQLKNKLDFVKKEYSMFMEFKNYATGLGWDEAKQTIVCSQEWWDKHLAKGIKCIHVKFRKQGPKFLDDLHIIFGKSHINGASASCPEDISSDEAGDDDVAKGLSSTVRDKDEKSPFSHMYKSTSSSASPCNVVPTIKTAMKMVKDCAVEEGTALLHTASSLIMKPEFREVLSSLEIFKGRLDLIEREHEKEMMKLR